MLSQEGEIIDPTLEIGYQAPRTTGALTPLKVTAAELKESIMARVETWTICDQLPYYLKYPLWYVKAALRMITTVTLIEMEQVIYTSDP